MALCDYWGRYRLQAAKAFDEAIAGYEHILVRQEAPEGATNTWWAYTVVLQTETPQVDWFKFRELFLANGGDDVYACWKLTYTEDFFVDEVSQYEGVWQQFGRQTQPGLCPTAGLSLSLSLFLSVSVPLSLSVSLSNSAVVCVCVCVCALCVCVRVSAAADLPIQNELLGCR